MEAFILFIYLSADTIVTGFTDFTTVSIRTGVGTACLMICSHSTVTAAETTCSDTATIEAAANNRVVAAANNRVVAAFSTARYYAATIRADARFVVCSTTAAAADDWSGVCVGWIVGVVGIEKVVKKAAEIQRSKRNERTVKWVLRSGIADGNLHYIKINFEFFLFKIAHSIWGREIIGNLIQYTG